jgi:hypothetical protein
MPESTAKDTTERAAGSKKSILITLGKRSQAEIEELKADREGVLMDRISDIVRGLKQDGRIDDDAQVVIAFVR